MTTPIARAPGKLVLSGAYSVLWGAPCLVAAVDRYAVAHRGRAPVHVAEEVKAAIELGLLDEACFVDVSGLRAPADGGSTRKIGLGSSAAIIVATLAAAHADPDGSVDRDRLFRDALLAHQTAQKGGSGVDVAASVFGGILACTIGKEGGLEITPRTLPKEIQIHVYASMHPASTQGMVNRVRAFERSSPARHKAIIEEARRGAEQAAVAETASDFLAALAAQDAALRTLGREALVPIFTEEGDVLAKAAANEGGFFGPSGAGGGDIGIFVSDRSPSDAFATCVAATGVEPIALLVGAPGVRVDVTESPPR